eukprot:m.226917 g.226917  ORF g.226917 m.226917 type:complete len:90 (-) comp17071_c0_seq1:359-628(-)
MVQFTEGFSGMSVTPRLGLGDSVRETAGAITESVIEGFEQISWSIKLAGIYIGVGVALGGIVVGASVVFVAFKASEAAHKKALEQSKEQ